jgi:hypothetical protein
VARKNPPKATGERAPAVVATSEAEPAWQTFSASNNDGGYTVQVPRKPNRGQAPGILGAKNRTVFRCSAGDLTYSIMGQPVPPAALDDGAPAVLSAARKDLASTHDGRVTNDKSIDVSGFPAREFRIASPAMKSNVILARTMLVGKRLYTVFVIGSEDAVAGPSARKFLNSFVPTK